MINKIVTGSKGALFVDGQEIGEVKSIEVSLENNFDKEPSFAYGTTSLSGTLKVKKIDSPYRRMSPTLRKHFKSVRMMGKLYI